MKKVFDSAQRLVIATHNPGKMREFGEILASHVKNLVSAGDLRLTKPEESGATFADNALIKARHAARISKSVALADDSGLCVKALNNQPGIFSARLAGPSLDFAHAMQTIHDDMGDAPDLSAHFICVLALAWPDGDFELFEGRIDGQICWPPRGNKGHGYDPIFVPRGHNNSFAEMDDMEKNAISHRGIAAHKLIVRLRI